jgi:hypothetical protein
MWPAVLQEQYLLACVRIDPFLIQRTQKGRTSDLRQHELGFRVVSEAGNGGDTIGFMGAAPGYPGEGDEVVDPFGELRRQDGPREW